ncbi:hypothetical protein G418_07797, partial [Rhodococcus qingshengii BKS 20-40]
IGNLLMEIRRNTVSEIDPLSGFLPRQERRQMSGKVIVGGWFAHSEPRGPTTIVDCQALMTCLAGYLKYELGEDNSNAFAVTGFCTQSSSYLRR